jgi:hypothetical protein
VVVTVIIKLISVVYVFRIDLVSKLFDIYSVVRDLRLKLNTPILSLHSKIRLFSFLTILSPSISIYSRSSLSGLARCNIYSSVAYLSSSISVISCLTFLSFLIRSYFSSMLVIIYPNKRLASSSNFVFIYS